MEVKTKRTLVKSAPELWELAAEDGRMEAWMAGLVGAPAPVSVDVTDRVPERALTFRCSTPDTPAVIAISLTESGFGTAVEITAQHSHPDPQAALAALEDLLDELGSPERRPFVGG